MYQMEPQRANNALRVSTGIKDRFLYYFLGELEKKKKGLKSEDAEKVTWEFIRLMPSNPYNPVWEIKGRV